MDKKRSTGSHRLHYFTTMFLKQHSVFDVLTAFALAAFMYSVCYGSIAMAFERRRQKRIPLDKYKYFNVKKMCHFLTSV